MLKVETRVHIRWMIRRDLEEVLAIERAAFPVPWVEEDFLKALRKSDTIGMVAESLPCEGSRVIGFMLYEMHKHHLEVVNFAVAAWHQRQGVGTQLVAKLASKLDSHRRTGINLCVSERNLPGQLFFRKQGFKCVGLIRNFYEDGDAYRMRLAVE